MLTEALLFLLNTLLSLLAGVFLLRFYMQRFRAPFQNPAGHFVVAVTDFAVKPLRRIMPGFLGWDWASLLPAFLFELVLVVISYALLGHGWAFPGALGALALFAAVKLLALSVNMLMWIVIIAAILSWVQPYHWISGLADALSRPFTAPLRRIIPLIANVDLTPLVLIILCQLVLMVPIAWLLQVAASLI